jgi:hypothetical protein
MQLLPSYVHAQDLSEIFAEIIMLVSCLACRRVGVSPPVDEAAGQRPGLPRLAHATRPAVMRMQVLDMGEEVGSVGRENAIGGVAMMRTQGIACRYSCFSKQSRCKGKGAPQLPPWNPYHSSCARPGILARFILLVFILGRVS